jgi:hypothetical protein
MENERFGWMASIDDDVMVLHAASDSAGFLFPSISQGQGNSGVLLFLSSSFLLFNGGWSGVASVLLNQSLLVILLKNLGKALMIWACICDGYEADIRS